MLASGDLGRAINESLDGVLHALDLRPVGDDHFRLPAESAAMFDRAFGGMLLAQAVIGAAATVEEKELHALHAAFVRAGSPGAALEVVVSRVRDGRSFATRYVSVLEDGKPLLVAVASFTGHRDEPDVAAPMPDVAPPDELPLLQDWASAVPSGRHWIERPPAVEMRLSESPSFLTGASGHSPRSHWMRLPRDVGDDPALQAALLAYASDFFLMDMVFRAHPDELGPGKANGLSLDHAMWFHRPVQFDRWHLHTQEAVAVIGERGLARGAIHDLDGRLVATVTQEVVLR